VFSRIVGLYALFDLGSLPRLVLDVLSDSLLHQEALAAPRRLRQALDLAA
jgi:hypothetical protein